MKFRKVLIIFPLFAFLITGCSKNKDDINSYRRPDTVLVEWRNYDSSLLQKEYHCKDDSNYEYVGDTPIRPSDPEFSYSFTGWSDASIDESTGRITFFANYESSLNHYQIIWQNWDGSTIEKDDSVPYGTMPSFDSSMPKRNSDSFHTYSFSNWEPAIHSVDGDQIYVATYISSFIHFKITLDSAGGELSQTEIDTYYGNVFNLPTPTRKGYTFLGWFDGDTKINDTGTWNHPSNKTFVAHWEINTYSIKYYLDGGTNNSSNPKTYTVESNFYFKKPTRTGYTFIGWFDSSDKKVSAIYPGTIGDVILTAKWSLTNYSITYYLNGGTNHPDNPNSYTMLSETISLKDPTREGFVFFGWYTSSNFSNNTKITEIKRGSIGNLSLYAAWYAKENKIYYNLDGGTNNSQNPSTYYVTSDTIILQDATRYGFEFDGWYDDNGNKITTIPKGSTGDIQLNARWKANKYLLTVLSEDESKGTVSCSGEGYCSESITVIATPADGYYFRGWFDGKTFVSTESTYTFAMPAKDYCLTAYFFTNEVVENNGIVPEISSDGKTVKYGLYPRSVVHDSSLISKLETLEPVDLNDWCFYNGFFYAKTTASLKTSPYFTVTYHFDDGTDIINGQDYWFKCEPIKWRILTSDENKYMLFSEELLDTHSYHSISWSDEPNNYSQSSIRAFLNSTNNNEKGFLKQAFAFNGNIIQTTIVDNSPASTCNETNTSCCDDTEDKVFLLSKRDLINENYGFSENDESSLVSRTTDWARAKGANVLLSSYYGSYWTRSPVNNSKGVTMVYYSGAIGTVATDLNSTCIRPAIVIEI